MLHRFKATILGTLTLTLAAASASAEMPDPVDVFLSGRIQVGPSPLLQVGERVSAYSPAQLDYAVFVHELVAYVTKEILPDAQDEYLESSEIPSRLSPGMPRGRSEFGAHCLIILGQIGTHVSPFAHSSLTTFQAADPGVFSYIARAGTTLLAVRQVWSALRNDVEDKRSGFSLNPKVSGKKVGAYLTFRW
jgi:hypothetical protein